MKKKKKINSSIVKQVDESQILKYMCVACAPTHFLLSLQSVLPSNTARATVATSL